MEQPDRARPPISICYLIESLGSGGAERQLVELVRHLDRERFKINVMVYRPGDFYLPELLALNIPVDILIRRNRWDIHPLLKLIQWLNVKQLDVIHAFLSTDNLYAVAAKIISGRGRVIVSERAGEKHYKGLRRLLRIWSFQQGDVVAVNSHAAKVELQRRTNWAEDKVVCIPNGIDTGRFHPLDADERAELRRELGISASEKIILTVGSYKPQKNHAGILSAVEGIDLSHYPARFFWVGEMQHPNVFSEIKHRIRNLNLEESILLLGARENVEIYYQVCDVLLLNSLWEGTPNVVLEALACGCPVIATDVADVGRYVVPGVTGWLVPPNDTKSLRETLQRVAGLPFSELRAMGEMGRAHLLRLGVGLETMSQSYEELYQKLYDESIHSAH